MLSIYNYKKIWKTSNVYRSRQKLAGAYPVLGSLPTHGF